MTLINLQNLTKIGQLDPVPLSADLVKRMLATARQRLRDAEFTQNSDETRFDCATPLFAPQMTSDCISTDFGRLRASRDITKLRSSAWRTRWELTLLQFGSWMACASNATWQTMTANWSRMLPCKSV